MKMVFWSMLLVLAADVVLLLCRKQDPASERIHAVFSGVVSLIGAAGAVYVHFAISAALQTKQAAESYMDELFVRAILKGYDNFAVRITLLCLLTGVVLLWNGVYRKGKNQLMIWLVSGILLQLVTLFCGIQSINAFFDAAIYMNSLFLFELMALHLVNTVLYLLRRRTPI